MSEALRFAVLGPQRARYGDRELDLGPGKQRAVLAVLLLSAGRPVPVPQIVDAVWPKDPPANGPNVVQKYVAGLRRVLEPERSPRTPGQVLTLTDAGYLIRVDPEAVDAVRFERMVRAAQRDLAAGSPADALGGLRTALELWHGEPLTGLPGPVFESARQRLVEVRATALETWVELELQLGRHRELTGRLVELVAEFPVRERLRHQLMIALYRCGRQAEALAVYREVDTLLREEYGLEPGQALQELHRRILRSDPGLDPGLDPDLDPDLDRDAPPAGDAPPPGSDRAGQGVPPPRSGGPGQVASSPVPGSPAAAGPAAAAEHPAPQRVAPVPPAPSPVPAPVPPASAHGGPGAFATPSPYAPIGRPAPPTTPPAWLSHLGTVGNVLLVFVTLGTMAWMSMLFYAVRRRSRWLLVASAGYLAAAVLVIYVLEMTDWEAEATALDGMAFVALVGSWLGGMVHVVLLNRRVLAVLAGQPVGARARLEEERRIRRDQARHLLWQYPAARHGLRIGRPDLPRSYDDGGLVDVNAVPDGVLDTLAWLPPEQRRRIVTDRAVRGPYGSVEDLVARCVLPPAAADRLREFLFFLPPAAPPPGAAPAPAAPEAPPAPAGVPGEPSPDGTGPGAA